MEVTRMEFLSERRIERIHKAVLSGRIIPYLAFVTGPITLLAALAVRLLARGEFTSFGESVWWAAQTVTTVGYGDVVPDTAFSKVVAVLVKEGQEVAEGQGLMVVEAMKMENELRAPRAGVVKNLSAK